MAASPTSRTIALGTGLRYHVLEWGAVDASLEHTVFLLHGFLDLAQGWAGVVEAGLAGRFHVVVPDLRGHGDSDWVGPGSHYYFPDYVADVHELVDALGRQRVSLVGHSVGGRIAAYYAGMFPARVAKLALLEGLGPTQNPEFGPEYLAVWLNAWQRARARSPRVYATLADAAARLREHDPLLDEAEAQRHASAGTTAASEGGLRFKHDPRHVSMGPYGFQLELAMQFWRAIRCPVLLVDGAESTLRLEPAEAARRRDAFAQASVATLPGAGHMMQRHQPAALARILADFLAP